MRRGGPGAAGAPEVLRCMLSGGIQTGAFTPAQLRGRNGGPWVCVSKGATPLQLVIYPARSYKLLDFDGEFGSARTDMASCLITAISPSGTVGHIASCGIPNAALRRLRNRSQNGSNSNHLHVHVWDFDWAVRGGCLFSQLGGWPPGASQPAGPWAPGPRLGFCGRSLIRMRP